MKIYIVYGTRPELIKLAPLIIKLRKIQNVQLTTISTGQHKEMLKSLENIFDIKPDISLDVMTDNQSVNQVISKVMDKMDKILSEDPPHLVFVQGDTATVLATGMACYFSRIKLAHVEAGLRSFNLDHPFPEEFNRRTVSIFADYNFAPTQTSAENLLNEGVDMHKVIVTGNTVIDALQLIGNKLPEQFSTKKSILVTAHRRENHGEGIDNICEAIIELHNKRKDIEFIWPVHPNPNVKEVVDNKLKDLERVRLLEPVDYISLLTMIKNAHIIWTDSGGIQEEAPSFKKPVLILREVTERPEVVSAGFGVLVGTSKNTICSKTEELLDMQSLYNEMVSGENPFGDGDAADKIIKHLLL